MTAKQMIKAHYIVDAKFFQIPDRPIVLGGSPHMQAWVCAADLSEGASCKTHFLVQLDCAIAALWRRRGFGEFEGRIITGPGDYPCFARGEAMQNRLKIFSRRSTAFSLLLHTVLNGTAITAAEGQVVQVGDRLAYVALGYGRTQMVMQAIDTTRPQIITTKSECPEAVVALADEWQRENPDLTRTVVDALRPQQQWWPDILQKILRPQCATESQLVFLPGPDRRSSILGWVAGEHHEAIEILQHAVDQAEGQGTFQRAFYVLKTVFIYFATVVLVGKVTLEAQHLARMARYNIRNWRREIAAFSVRELVTVDDPQIYECQHQGSEAWVQREGQTGSKFMVITNCEISGGVRLEFVLEQGALSVGPEWAKLEPGLHVEPSKNEIVSSLYEGEPLTLRNIAGIRKRSEEQMGKRSVYYPDMSVEDVDRHRRISSRKATKEDLDHFYPADILRMLQQPTSMIHINIRQAIRDKDLSAVMDADFVVHMQFYEHQEIRGSSIALRYYLNKTGIHTCSTWGINAPVENKPEYTTHGLVAEYLQKCNKQFLFICVEIPRHLLVVILWRASATAEWSAYLVDNQLPFPVVPRDFYPMGWTSPYVYGMLKKELPLLLNQREIKLECVCGLPVNDFVFVDRSKRTGKSAFLSAHPEEKCKIAVGDPGVCFTCFCVMFLFVWTCAPKGATSGLEVKTAFLKGLHVLMSNEVGNVNEEPKSLFAERLQRCWQWVVQLMAGRGGCPETSMPSHLILEWLAMDPGKHGRLLKTRNKSPFDLWERNIFDDNYRPLDRRSISSRAQQGR